MDELRSTRELSPGVYRIETVDEGKLLGYHVLDGPRGPIVVDTGAAGAIEGVYEPFFEAQNWELADVPMALITHADGDHHGANHDFVERSSGVTIAAHAADAGWIESADQLMDERYGRFEETDGLAYDEDLSNGIAEMLGPDERVTLRLSGGERIAVRDRTFELLHTPGHTRGHLMLYDRAHDLVIGGDGFFGRGLYDVDGERFQPPPYYHYPEYETTIQLVSSLAPETLSFTHYDVMTGDEIDAFVSESRTFVNELAALALEVLDERGTITLREAIDDVVDRKGSFGLDIDLAAPLSAHYTDFVEQGELVVTEKDGVRAWTRA